MSHLDIINRIIDHWKHKDGAAFYCPYVPLTMTGVVPPSVTPGATASAVPMLTFPMTLRYVTRFTQTVCAIEGRSNQGGWFDTVAVMSFRGWSTSGETAMKTITEWCVGQWGESGPEPALWRQDDNILYLRDDRLLVELTMRWQGVEL